MKVCELPKCKIELPNETTIEGSLLCGRADLSDIMDAMKDGFHLYYIRTGEGNTFTIEKNVVYVDFYGVLFSKDEIVFNNDKDPYYDIKSLTITN